MLQLLMLWLSGALIGASGLSLYLKVRKTPFESFKDDLIEMQNELTTKVLDDMEQLMFALHKIGVEAGKDKNGMFARIIKKAKPKKKTTKKVTKK